MGARDVSPPPRRRCEPHGMSCRSGAPVRAPLVISVASRRISPAPRCGAGCVSYFPVEARPLPSPLTLYAPRHDSASWEGAMRGRHERACHGRAPRGRATRGRRESAS
eukprot:scaffold10460_cov53-Phaeocystis_antarctica.AAC.1